MHPKEEQKAFVGCGVALLALFLPLGYFTLWARIDSVEDREFFQPWDIFLGLLPAAAVVLLRGGTRVKRSTLVLAGTTWVLVSGSCLLCHEFQVRVRWTVPNRLLALNRVKEVHGALQEYANDCGEFPPRDKGLAALHTNPGLPGWRGPYIEVKQLTDPWGNTLQYRVNGERVEVWSNGPDGKSGTEDDIRLDDN
jgi:hypothetical protein